MEFARPLTRATLVRRYKRFFVDVTLDDGQEITAHCPNPGAMLGVCAPGSTVWLSRSDSPTRKLAHTLELVEAGGGLVGVNTMLPNRLTEEAIRAGRIGEMTGYETILREVPYGEASRVDFVLEQLGRPSCYLEVKNVTVMRTSGLAEFPDCVSVRASNHLRELQAVVQAGYRAAVLFLVQRSDCSAFAVAADMDVKFAAALNGALEGGVEVLCYGCEMTTRGVTVSTKLDWRPQ